ncbi:S53 family peptidase [Catenulispora yoronensis]|uniref:S53 family peptidase n=1 Tax=Catenulispora yoronensis TaxID=450799 RepID=A0ABN2UFB2_9ACTN
MLRYLGCAVAAVALTAGTAQGATGRPVDRGASADRDGSVSVRIGLAGRDPAGLEAFARAVSTPGSPEYGRFLTPEQARARFGATDTQVSAVRRWLGRAGMSVTGQSTHWIDATGSPVAARTAFGSSLGLGLRTLTLPADVTGAVTTVARIGQARQRGVREGASAALQARKERTSHSGGVMGGPTRVSAHVDSGVATDGVHSPGAVPSAKPTAHPPADTTPAAPSAKPGAKPTTTSSNKINCSPTWGAVTADPKLPPGYTTPEPLDVCGYAPSQLRTAYGVAASGLTGAGVRVAVIDAYGSPTMRADADRFARAHGDAPFADGQYLETVTPARWTHTNDKVCQTPADWAGEEALDVETVHGMAPGATVHYFGSNSCSDEDINATVAQIVDTRAADIVSSSLGETMHRTTGGIDPALISQATQLFAYGAAEGIGFYYATGDCGNDSVRTGPSCDPESARAQTEWPVSSPWVTGVGGTALALGPDAAPLWESSMGDRRSVLSDDGKRWVPFPGDFYFGGGGGTSEDFQQPSYQRGVVPDRLARTLSTGRRAAKPMRTLPDVAMNGDLMTAVLVGATDATTGRYDETPIGGTSASTPMFAGVQAVAQQARVAAGGGAIGFANPVIYQHANQNTFMDVVAHPAGAPTIISAVLDLGPDAQGKARTRLFELGSDQGLPAGPGYDLATGLGAPRAGYLESFKH